MAAKSQDMNKFKDVDKASHFPPRLDTLRVSAALKKYQCLQSCPCLSQIKIQSLPGHRSRTDSAAVHQKS